MSNNIDSIKAKIRALLAKNVENGASEAEMNSALEMANKLMRRYLLSISDLEDPFYNENCIYVEFNRPKTAYDETVFYPYLCNLFDVIHFYTKKKVTFFGFENDVKLAGYFHDLIVKSAFKAADEYKQEHEYLVLSKKYSGRSLVSSFLKGFFLRVSDKMEEMYENRKGTVATKEALVLVKKSDKVRDQYDAMGFNVKKKKNNFIVSQEIAYMSGIKKGDELSLTQGIEDGRKEISLKLN